MPVPSESPRDLKFNAGKIDEYVTSMGWTYTDRFGQKHYTIEGNNYLSQQAMAAYGYVILSGKTFTTGATINNPNEVLLNTADGEYYKWTGSFASGPKVVPANSTPAGTGGVGPGAWVGVGDASLRAMLGSSGNGNGDSLIAVKSPLTGGVARTQHDKNTDYVTPEDFGAIGDGTSHPLSEKFSTIAAAQAVYPFVTALTQTIDWAAIQSVINSGKPLLLKSAYVAGNKFTSSNRNISIIGEGLKKSKIIFSTTDGGFDFTFTPQGSGVTPQQLTLSSFSIETGVNVTTPAIKANWGSRQPNAYGQAWISDVNIVSNNSTLGSFEAGIDLIYCVGGFIDRVKILGDSSRAGNDAFRLQGCIEIHVTNSHANRYKCPARVKKYVVGDQQSEGLFFNACFFYDCNMGFMSPDQAIHINLIGTFINPNGTASSPVNNIASIDITNCSQYTIQGCLIYIGGLSTDGINQDAIRITSGGGGIVDSNQIISVQKANTRYGILLSSDASYGKYTNNKINSTSAEAIRILSSSARGNEFSKNYLYDCSLQINDSGTGTIRSGNMTCASLDVPKMYDPEPIGTGGIKLGTLGGNASWGAFLWPNAGSAGDVALCDTSGVVVASTYNGKFGVKSYAKASLPPAAYFGAGCGGLIIVTDDVGGVTLAFSDGTAWRRVQDRNIIS